MKTFLFSLSVILAFSACPLQAQEESPVEARMRETLKALTVRLRTVETDRVNLQGVQAQNEAQLRDQATQIEELKKKLAAATKQASADHDASRRSIDGLNAKLQVREKEIAQTKEALEKWKAGFNKAATVARAKEDERAKATSKSVVYERRVRELESKNLELYKIGSDVLQRYENFGLGKALLAREPFVGSTKVQLQTLVQDYSDKLQDNKFSPFHDDASNSDAARVQEPSGKPQPTAAPPGKPAKS